MIANPKVPNPLSLNVFPSSTRVHSKSFPEHPGVRGKPLTLPLSAGGRGDDPPVVSLAVQALPVGRRLQPEVVDCAKLSPSGVMVQQRRRQMHFLPHVFLLPYPPYLSGLLNAHLWIGATLFMRDLESFQPSSWMSVHFQIYSIILLTQCM